MVKKIGFLFFSHYPNCSCFEFFRKKKKGYHRTQKSRSEGISCILMAAGKRIPVTSGAQESDSRTTAGLIRYCLNDLGHRLQDE